MSSEEYLLDNARREAGARFGALAELFDTVTFRHISVLGIGPGWRCWEVGAGGPSVPAWLSDRVGAYFPIAMPAAAALDAANVRQARSELAAHGHASEDELDAHAGGAR